MNNDALHATIREAVLKLARTMAREAWPIASDRLVADIVFAALDSATNEAWADAGYPARMKRP